MPGAAQGPQPTPRTKAKSGRLGSMMSVLGGRKSKEDPIKELMALGYHEDDCRVWKLSAYCLWSRVTSLKVHEQCAQSQLERRHALQGAGAQIGPGGLLVVLCCCAWPHVSACSCGAGTAAMPALNLADAVYIHKSICALARTVQASKASLLYPHCKNASLLAPLSTYKSCKICALSKFELADQAKELHGTQHRPTGSTA